MASEISLDNYKAEIKNFIETFHDENKQMIENLLVELQEIEKNHRFYKFQDVVDVKESVEKIEKQLEDRTIKLLEKFKNMNYDECIKYFIQYKSPTEEQLYFILLKTANTTLL